MMVTGREWDQMLYVTEKPDLSHFEEWVSSRDSASMSFDEDIKNDRQRHSESQVNPQHLHRPFSARVFSLLLN
jgi:hypothetical protein